MVSSAPRAIVHQLTALPDTLEGLSPDALTAALRANARMRTEGTRNLTAAATRAGATRLVAQSIAWSYAPGPEPHTEDAPLDVTADGNRRVTIDGVVALERAVLQAPGIEGVVLRYGFLYGHRPGVDRPQRIPSVHVEAAAWAATLAIDHGGPGVYNIVDDDPTVSNTKARRQLGWDPRFRTEPARGERQAAQSRS